MTVSVRWFPAALSAVLCSALVAGCRTPTPTQASSSSTSPQTVTPVLSGVRVLIDASRDGGVWWGPQAGTFDPNSPHQGKPFADALRALGATVDEVPRDALITDATLAGYRIIIRTGSCGSYSPDEIVAYRAQTSREVGIILLGAPVHGGCPDSDQVAKDLAGMTFVGVELGTITEFTPHPITTGVVTYAFGSGSTVSEFDPARAQILAVLGPERRPAMGLISGYVARIFVSGDSPGLVVRQPQPLLNNLLRWAIGTI